jgi:hemerythrin superfamily protein
MDAIELLTAEHRDVEALFERFARAGSPNERAALFAQIADALVVHATVEELHFYPAVEAADEDLIGASYEEHLEVKRRIAELLDMDPADDAFAERCRELHATVERHVDEEEGELFPEVRRTFDEDMLQSIGRQMAATRVELQAEGPPRESAPAPQIV